MIIHIHDQIPTILDTKVPTTAPDGVLLIMNVFVALVTILMTEAYELGR